MTSTTCGTDAPHVCCARCLRRAQGSLRAAIDGGVLDDRLTGRPAFHTVLTLALVCGVCVCVWAGGVGVSVACMGCM
jgi:hypothetical protein